MKRVGNCDPELRHLIGNYLETTGVGPLRAAGERFGQQKDADTLGEYWDTYLLETAKYWLLKEAIELLFARLPEMLKEFEELVGTGGACGESDRRQRMIHRAAFAVYSYLIQQPRDSALNDRISTWTRNAEELAELPCTGEGDVKFSSLDDLQFLACRFLAAETIRAMLILDFMPPISNSPQ